MLKDRKGLYEEAPKVEQLKNQLSEDDFLWFFYHTHMMGTKYHCWILESVVLGLALQSPNCWCIWNWDVQAFDAITNWTQTQLLKRNINVVWWWLEKHPVGTMSLELRTWSRTYFCHLWWWSNTYCQSLPGNQLYTIDQHWLACVLNPLHKLLIKYRSDQ